MKDKKKDFKTYKLYNPDTGKWMTVTKDYIDWITANRKQRETKKD